MGLFTTIGYDNLVTHEALSIRYAISAKTEAGEWEVHRYTTKSFSFVGLTEDTARDYAARLSSITIGGYSLARYYDYWKPGDDGKMERTQLLLLKDEVAAVHDSGPMWRIDVNVNEDDIRYVDEDELGNSPTTWGFPSGGNYWEPVSE